jgi:hypothetical protein
MQIVFDLFPARVFVAPQSDELDALTYEELTVLSSAPHSRRVDAVRVVITEATVMIAADSPSGPMLIFQEKYDPASLQTQKNRAKPSRLRTLSGKVIVFEKDENCGCGSRLRSWNPYRTVYSTKDPIE